MKAPFPYFGGKSTVAPLVWDYLGNPRHYIEPFFGSGAVLLSRPLGGKNSPSVETVCDADGLLCNVWRSLQADPDAVAKRCDWPVNHADLSARKKRLIKSKGSLLEKLIADDEYFDPLLAGYWTWSASCWIGSGLTFLGQIPHVSDSGKGVHAIGQRPHVGNAGMGVHALGQIPHVGTAGMGVHALGQRPHVGDSGKGVHAIGQRPHVGDSGKGVQEPYNGNLYEWFRQLSERLRYVRVVCGDWTRVCGGNWQDKMGTVGIFLDPPYSHDCGRHNSIYDVESADVAKAATRWAHERGDRKAYRIVIAGYEGEHDWLEQAGWSVKSWSAQGGYSNHGEKRSANRHRERLWISPHCLNVQQEMFA